MSARAWLERQREYRIEDCEYDEKEIDVSTLPKWREHSSQTSVNPLLWVLFFLGAAGAVELASKSMHVRSEKPIVGRCGCVGDAVDISDEPCAIEMSTLNKVDGLRVFTDAGEALCEEETIALIKGTWMSGGLVKPDHSAQVEAQAFHGGCGCSGLEDEDEACEVNYDSIEGFDDDNVLTKNGVYQCQPEFVQDLKAGIEKRKGKPSIKSKILKAFKPKTRRSKRSVEDQREPDDKSLEKPLSDQELVVMLLLAQNLDKETGLARAMKTLVYRHIGRYMSQVKGNGELPPRSKLKDMGRSLANIVASAIPQEMAEYGRSTLQELYIGAKDGECGYQNLTMDFTRYLEHSCGDPDKLADGEIRSYSEIIKRNGIMDAKDIGLYRCASYGAMGPPWSKACGEAMFDPGSCRDELLRTLRCTLRAGSLDSSAKHSLYDYNRVVSKCSLTHYAAKILHIDFKECIIKEFPILERIPWKREKIGSD